MPTVVLSISSQTFQFVFRPLVWKLFHLFGISLIFLHESLNCNYCCQIYFSEFITRVYGHGKAPFDECKSELCSKYSHEVRPIVICLPPKISLVAFDFLLNRRNYFSTFGFRVDSCMRPVKFLIFIF